jgi:alpha-L-fucosidase
MRSAHFLLSFLCLLHFENAFSQVNNTGTEKDEHASLGITQKGAGADPSKHPDAQWYPNAGLGLFIHWGISSVRDLDASWPMMVGWDIKDRKIDSLEIERIVTQKDYKVINGDRFYLTPNEYWAMAKDFTASNFNPDKWIKAAKDAGFTYAVLTTKHHEGFALWPSAYGNFNTKNFIGGKDLVRPFVEACRKYGLKVGLYFSPPDWYFDKEYRNFLFGGGGKNNPNFPALDADLNPRYSKPSPEAVRAHKAAYAEMIRGQITELLTNYGKIDLLWFDGKAAIDNPTEVVTQQEIRRLQPGVVINPRLHGTGDFKTFERTPPSKDPGDIWAEFCNPWTNSWANSNTIPFRSNAFMLGQFVTMRSWGVNYLPSVGPKADGSMPDAVYQNMKVVERWMNANSKSVKNVQQLPAGEKASVPATADKNNRYLFAIPAFRKNGMYEEDRLPAVDTALTLETPIEVKSVRLLATGKKLKFRKEGSKLQVELPAEVRSNLVDVIHVELKN